MCAQGPASNCSDLVALARGCLSGFSFWLQRGFASSQPSPRVRVQPMAVSLVTIAQWGQALSPGCHLMFTLAPQASEKQAPGSLPDNICGSLILENHSILFQLMLVPGCFNLLGRFSDSGAVGSPLEKIIIAVSLP